MEIKADSSTINDASKKELLKREANVYEEKIDNLIYELYGLTEEEKKVVDESLK